MGKDKISVSCSTPFTYYSLYFIPHVLIGLPLPCILLVCAPNVWYEINLKRFHKYVTGREKKGGKRKIKEEKSALGEPCLVDYDFILS